MNMSTMIKPELSKKNEYWIPKYRYYELKYFCLQYPSWIKMCMELEGLSKRPDDLAAIAKSNNISNPTEACAIELAKWSGKVDLIKKAAKETDETLASYLIQGITEGCSFDVLNARITVPCTREEYYNLYRKFFYILDKARE